MEGKTAIPEFALHWALRLGANLPSLNRLRGGINNQVFRCSHGLQHWVIKGYADAQAGQGDRMQAEVEFLQFASQAAPGFTPSLIHVDSERRCVVLEHLEGRGFAEGSPPSEAALTDAVEFFRQLNADKKSAKKSILLDAVEGFNSLHEHLSNVRERINRMSSVHLHPQYRPQAETLLSQLNREWAEIERHTTKMIDQGKIINAITPELRYVSPSDFGFHNAIRTPERTYFIDFEFAGWDDPAKAALDFILQPRVPVAKQRSPLLDALPPEHRLTVYRRCEVLGPILRIKWACIVLAVLQPTRLEQIMHNMPEQSPEDLIRNRIERAYSYLRKPPMAAYLSGQS